MGRTPGGGAPEGRTPKGGAPKSRMTQAPKVRPVGKPPNPRKPALVRDVGGGILKDMFQIFPDLPRPRRARGRKPSKTSRLR